MFVKLYLKNILLIICYLTRYLTRYLALVSRMERLSYPGSGFAQLAVMSAISWTGKRQRFKIEGRVRLHGVFDLETLPGGENEFDVDIPFSLFAYFFENIKNPFQVFVSVQYRLVWRVI